ncbi:unnamed protein product [Lathyrus oleraceus]
MRKSTASLVLVLLLVTIFFNGYSVKGVERENQRKKDDGNFKSQKSWRCIDCMILRVMCLNAPHLWPAYSKFCSVVGRTNLVARKSKSDLP